MYNDSISDTGIEDLVLDFIMYRKKLKNGFDFRNENVKQTKKQPLMPLEGYKEEKNTKPEEMPIPEKEKQVENLEIKELKNKVENAGITTYDIAYMQSLYSKAARILKPYVDKVLDDYLYEGSPVYEGDIDRETLAQVVDKVIYLASQNVDEISSIAEQEGIWGSTNLLRQVVELVVINEIYLLRQPTFKKVSEQLRNEDFI